MPWRRLLAQFPTPMMPKEILPMFSCLGGRQGAIPQGASYTERSPACKWQPVPAVCGSAAPRLRVTLLATVGAVAWKLLDRSPLGDVRYLPENNARLRYLAVEEIDACSGRHMT